MSQLIQQTFYQNFLQMSLALKLSSHSHVLNKIENIFQMLLCL